MRDKMIITINDYIKRTNVNEKNALEFMLEDSNFYSNLIKRYICSQLKINHHLKYILSNINYKGPIYEPLDQIINNKNPFLWDEILKYDTKCKNYKLTTDDLFYQIISKSDIIYKNEFKLNPRLENLKFKLSDLSHYRFITRKLILLEIKKLEETIKKINININHYEGDLSKQKQWKNFIKETIQQIKLNMKDVDNISITNYMFDKIFLSFYLDELKNDIVLNYNLVSYIYFSSNIDESIEVILNNITNIFNQYNEEKIEYRDYNLKDKQSKICDNIVDYSNIKSKLIELDNLYKDIKKIDNVDEYIKKIILLYQEFIKIYPYNKCNGRISRYLFNSLLLKKGIIPPPLYENHSKRYQIDRLSDEYMLGNIELLNDYIFVRIKKFNQ